MEREDGREFFYERRNKPKNVTVAFTIKPETLKLIDELRIGTESRSSVIRRLIDAGLPVLERRKRLEEQQVRLGPISEEDEKKQ